MTKREKLRILKAMKVRLAECKDQGWVGYLCMCYRDAMKKLLFGWLPSEDKIIELGITRPRGYKKYDGWWDDFDYTSRLRALNKAIRKLEPKK